MEHWKMEEKEPGTLPRDEVPTDQFVIPQNQVTPRSHSNSPRSGLTGFWRDDGRYMSKGFVNAEVLPVQGVSSLFVTEELLALSSSPTQRHWTPQTKRELN